MTRGTKPLLAGFALAALFAAAALPAAEPASPVEAVARQKLKLLQGLLGAPKTAEIAEGGNAVARGLVSRARSLAEQARGDLDAGQSAAAGQALDEALRALSSASSLTRDGDSLGASAQRAQYEDLLQQVRGYREAILEALRKRGDATHPALDKVHGLLAHAEGAASAGNYGEANQALAEANRTAIGAVTELRSGETVVHALKFDTPADEYVYEQKRHDSYEALLKTVLSEGRTDAGALRLVDRNAAEARSLCAQAERLAAGGDYPGAIKAMEEATGRLLASLRLLGMPVWQ